MTRAISRDSFNELKQYIGVHLQQGRVMLDSDWNEGQDIMATLARRLGQDAFTDGVLGEGFEIQPVIPSPWLPVSPDFFEIPHFQAHLPVSMRFPPTAPFDAFESTDGWTLTGTGKFRTSRDRPYEGQAFLRVSDQTGQVTVARTLSSPVDLSQFQYAHFRFRLNPTNPSVPSGAASFFIEDSSGNRNVWPLTAPWAAKDTWFPGAALPLDLRLQLFDIDLFPAMRGQNYTSLIPVLGTSGSPTWSTTGTLPPGLSLTTATAGATPLYGRLTGTPTQTGSFTFTVTATVGGQSASRSFTLAVQDPTTVPGQTLDPGFSERFIPFWDKVKARGSTPTGTAANLSSIKKYGFLISPQGAAPAIWDFDALYFSSRSLVQAKAANNFVIGGPLESQVLDVFLNAVQMDDSPEAGDAVQSLVQIPQILTGTPRAYVGGLACTQPREVLYSDQLDPNDVALTTPTSGVRKDLVYLDVTREPVTYIDDPELREVALGGPDTSTRMRVRQRVRVALGNGSQPGALPVGDGTGGGTLATEGSYTDRSNRLYLVEVDTAGDIGTATLRWSEDNASTIQRVIETVPPSSTKVKVEDASAFRPGDFILLRKEFQHEEHRIASILGNTITLQEATGASTTFALTDRPKIQRWNAFHAPVVADPNDSTVSAPINLSFGVAVRIGGRALKKGDFWTFRTRYLAGDEASGINTISRIEAVNFQRPQGIVHQYAPLAMIVRDAAAHLPDRVHVIRDQRRRAGRIVHHRQSVSDLSVTQQIIFSDFIYLGVTSIQSMFLCVWTGTAQADAAGRTLQVTVDFYTNDLTTPGSFNGIVGNGQPMNIACDGLSLQRSGVMLIERIGFPGVVAARPRYGTPAGNITVTGTLSMFELRCQLQDIATFPFDL